jgi:hypothetical protein
MIDKICGTNTRLTIRRPCAPDWGSDRRKRRRMRESQARRGDCSRKINVKLEEDRGIAG